MGSVLQLRPHDSTTPDCGNAAELLATIEQIAKSAMDGQIDGLMVTLAKDGKIIGESLAGEFRQNRPLAQSAVYRMMQRIEHNK